MNRVIHFDLYAKDPERAKYVEKVKMAGGTIAMEATKVEDMGTMASFRDTEGNSVGLMQFGKMAM